jgi:hypothetical protein
MYSSRVEDFINSRGNHPAMEAAKHNQADALVLLLQPMVQLSMQGTPEAFEALNSFVHKKNQQGHTLLYAVSHHSTNLFLPHSIVLHLEQILHGGDSEEVQKCIKESLGSSKMSKAAVNVVKRRTPGATAQFLNVMRIFLLVFFIPMSFFIVDMVTDALLVGDYYGDMVDEASGRYSEAAEAAQICQTNLTLICFSRVPSGAAKFHLSVLIMIFPFVFYGVEVIKYYQSLHSHSSANIRGRPQGVRLVGAEEPLESLHTMVSRWFSTWDSRTSFYLFGIRFQPLRLPIYIFVWLIWPFWVFLLNLIHRMKQEGSGTSDKIDKHSENVKTYQVMALIYLSRPLL